MVAHRILGGSSSSLSVSCPSLGSELIAAACAHLWSLLRWYSAFCGHMGKESPLLCTLKQWSLASWAGPDFFLDSLPASCGALATFRLCSRNQPQSSPWDLTSKAQASALSPHLPWRVSRQAFLPGEFWLAVILCMGISPLCPLHPCCCALLRGSEAPPRQLPVFTSEGAS